MPRAVAPRTGAPEVTVAEEQEQYMPVTVAFHRFADEAPGVRHLVTRWTFTPEERARIAAGEDVYVGQLNFGGPMTPLVVSAGPGPYAPPAPGP